MFARKLGRFAGLVFVLAVVFGGATAAAASADGGSDPTAARGHDSSYSANSSYSTNGITEWD